MATMEVVLRRAWVEKLLGGRSAASRITATNDAQDYRLRALPNEEILFWRKRIDNSRVSRKPDRGTRRAAFGLLTAAGLCVIAVLAMLAPGSYSRMAGYEIHALEQERARLLNERKLLEVEQARLASVGRLETLARRWRFVDPRPGQSIHLHAPPAADGALAWNPPNR